VKTYQIEEKKKTFFPMSSFRGRPIMDA